MNPSWAHSDSWVSMLWRGTWRRSASSAPVQARRGVLSSSAVTRWRRVGGRGPRGRAGARRDRRGRSTGGVWTTVAVAGAGGGAGGGASFRVWEGGGGRLALPGRGGGRGGGGG